MRFPSLPTLCVAVCLLAAALPARAARILSDTWWSPSESGWSLVLEHREEVSHAMLHVYDDQGLARWYMAPLSTTAITAEGLPLLTGVLYAASGPPHGSEWDPGQVSVVPAGEIEIVPHSVRVLSVRYDLEGTEKQVVLQRFGGVATSLAGAFSATAVLRASGGGEPIEALIEQRTVQADYFEGGVFGMVVTGGDSPCNYMGEVETVGRTSEVAGVYNCADGTSGPFLLEDMVETPHGFTGRLRRRHGDRTYAGSVAWLRL